MNFACPSCGFRVFNRRYSKCERCGKDLPSEMLLTSAQINKLDTDAESSRRAQQSRAAADSMPYAAAPVINALTSVWVADAVLDVASELASDIVQGLGNDLS
jgi:hypothetical protein